MDKRKRSVKRLVREVRKKQERKFEVTLKRLEEFKNSNESKAVEQFYARKRDKK